MTREESKAYNADNPKCDLISRADAIEAVESLPNTPNGFSDTYDKACIIGLIEALPSAEVPSVSAERVGEWIVEYGDKHYKRCSVCGKAFYSLPRSTNYCSNCGAKMKGDINP